MSAPTIDIARRHRAERATWENLASRLAWMTLEDAAHADPGYLHAQPFKADLAVMTGARMNERTAHCFACGEGQMVYGSSLEAFDWMAQHNAERHPRRWREMLARGGR